MNEQTVLKSSRYVFFIGCVILGILGIFFKDVSYVLGYILGYIINTIVFLLTIKMVDGILTFSNIMIVVFAFILKLGLYALGFYLAVKLSYIHIIGVFMGYMINKVTIYKEGYKHKGGEMSGN